MTIYYYNLDQFAPYSSQELNEIPFNTNLSPEITHYLEISQDPAIYRLSMESGELCSTKLDKKTCTDIFSQSFFKTAFQVAIFFQEVCNYTLNKIIYVEHEPTIDYWALKKTMTGQPDTLPMPHYNFAEIISNYVINECVEEYKNSLNAFELSEQSRALNKHIYFVLKLAYNNWQKLEGDKEWEIDHMDFSKKLSINQLKMGVESDGFADFNSGILNHVFYHAVNSPKHEATFLNILQIWIRAFKSLKANQAIFSQFAAKTFEQAKIQDNSFKQQQIDTKFEEIVLQSWKSVGITPKATRREKKGG